MRTTPPPGFAKPSLARGSRASRHGPAVLAVLALAALCGCASTPAGSPQALHAQQPDPWEATNRKVFAFNDAVDRALIRPAAEVYVATVPAFARDAVSQVMRNLQDAWSTVNWILQGEPHRAALQGARFAWNSSVGVAGLFDPATPMGLLRDRRDFGQTLATWGLGPGPYLVLPILGPSTLRDTAALPADLLAFGSSYVSDTGARLAVTALEITSVRASYLSAEKIMDSVALDRYSFLRDAYLQRRAAAASRADPADFEPLPPAGAASQAAR